MASKIVLFYRTLSPPSRAVLLTAKAIGINLELKDINVLKGEHLTAEYRKVCRIDQLCIRDTHTQFSFVR